MKEITENNRLSEIFVIVSSLITLLFGSFTLFGWLLDIPVLTNYGSDSLLPTAPDTAFLFILSGIALIFFIVFHSNRYVHFLKTVTILIELILAVSLFILSCTGIELSAEHFYLDLSQEVSGFPVGHMSPLTAACFILIAFSLLIIHFSSSKHPKWGRISFLLSSVVIIVSLLLITAYLLGTPLMYDGQFIPTALPTSLAFLMLSLGLFVYAGHNIWTEKETSAINMRISMILVPIFILLATGIIMIGYFYYSHYEKQYRTEAEHQLYAITDLKVNEIVQWRKERLGDASVFFNNSNFTMRVRQFFNSPTNKDIKERAATWMRQVREAYNYDRVCLHNKQGIEYLSVPDKAVQVDSLFSLKAMKVLQTGQITFEDFYRGEYDGRIYLGVVIPILDKLQASKPIGILSLRIDPKQYLYPYIKKWPGTSETSETLLIRREGDQVVFLNELRHQANTALTLRIPVDKTDLPASKAVRGEQGIVEGKDYRGIQVVACIASIPDSPWFIVTKTDKSELYAPLRERLWILIILIGAFLFSIGSGLGLIWRKQNLRFYEEKYQTSKALQESENKFSETIRYLDEGYYRSSVNGILEEHNLAFNKILGFDPEEDLRGAALPDFWQNPTERKQYVTELMSKGSVINYMINAKKHNGEKLDILANSHLTKNSKGQPDKIEGTFTDFTERMRAERALESSYRFLELAYSHTETAPLLEAFVNALKEFTQCEAIGIRIMDDEGNIPYQAYKGFSQPFYEEENLLSIHSDTCMCINVIRGNFDPGLPFYTEGGSFYMNGTTKFLANISEEEKGQTRNTCNKAGYESVALVPIRVQKNKILGLIQIADSKENMIPVQTVEILEKAGMQVGAAILRTQAEEALKHLSSRQQALLDAIPDIIMEVNNDKIYTWANHAGLDFFGDDVVGKEAAYFFEGEQKTYNEIQPLLNGNDNIVYIESWQRRRDNKKRLLAWWCRVLKDDKGNTIGALSSARDITERRQAQEILAKKTQELEIANNELEQVLYATSHDLRSPLVNVQGFNKELEASIKELLDILTDADIPPDIKNHIMPVLTEDIPEAIHYILASTLKMDTLLTGLLRLSRVGRQKLTLTRLNINELVSDVLQTLQIQIKESNVKITISDLPSCTGDAVQINQVFSNLIENAIKYLKPNQDSEIKISGEKLNKYAVYCIEDNGIGMVQDHLGKIFDMFHQLDPSKKGTGLGLTIVKRIIEKHDGSIRVESEYGKGSRFYVEIPC